jgi:hypothetical protein
MSSLSNNDFLNMLESKTSTGSSRGKRSKAPASVVSDKGGDTKSAKRQKRELGFDLHEQIRLEREENKAAKKRMAKERAEEHKADKNKKGKKKKGKAAGQATEDDAAASGEAEAVGYRDRAKERRMGIVVEEEEAATGDLAVQASSSVIPSEYAHFMSATSNKQSAAAATAVAPPVIDPVLKQIGSRYPSGNKRGPVFESFFAKALYNQLLLTRQKRVPDSSAFEPGKLDLVFDVIATDHDGSVQYRPREDASESVELVQTEAMKLRAPMLLHPARQVMDEITRCFSDPDRVQQRHQERQQQMMITKHIHSKTTSMSIPDKKQERVVAGTSVVAKPKASLRPHHAKKTEILDESFDLFGGVGRDYVVKVKPERSNEDTIAPERADSVGSESHPHAPTTAAVAASGVDDSIDAGRGGDDDDDDDDDDDANDVVGPVRPPAIFDVSASYQDANAAVMSSDGGSEGEITNNDGPARRPQNYDVTAAYGTVDSHTADNASVARESEVVRPARSPHAAVADVEDEDDTSENVGPMRPPQHYDASAAYGDTEDDASENVGPMRPPQGYDASAAYGDTEDDTSENVGPMRPPQNYDASAAYGDVKDDMSENVGPMRPPQGYNASAAYSDVQVEAQGPEDINQSMGEQEWVHFPTAEELDDDGRAGNVELVEVETLDVEECAQIIQILEFKLLAVSRRLQFAAAALDPVR